MKNNYKATLTLGLAAACFAGTYPYSDSFWGGMLNSGFGAATVGGMADWFAVSALFHKPLGFISWRTEVIPRKRERLFDDIVALVETDLLTSDNIMEIVRKYDLAALVLDYLQEHGGRKNVQDVLVRLGRDAVESVDAAEVGSFIDQLLKEQVKDIRLAPVVAALIDKSVKKNYDDAIVRFILATLHDIVTSDKFFDLLCETVSEALRKYEDNGLIRQWLDKNAAVTPNRISEKMIGFASNQLNELQEDDHPLRANLKSWLCNQLERFKNDPEMQEKLENWKNNSLLSANNTIVGQTLQRFVEELQEKIKTGETIVVDQYMSEITDILIEQELQEQERRETLNRWADKMILRLAETWRGSIGNLVRTRLDRFTNEQLVAFIEARVGDDLQMIRINGSVVGGLAGMLLFAITSLAERML